MIRVFVLILVVIFSLNTYSQTDTTKNTTSTASCEWLKTRYVKESIAPVVLTLSSLTVLALPELKQNLQNTLNWNDDRQPEYINLGDDYIRFAPAVAAYAISFCGVKSKHRFIDKTAILTVSYVLSDFMVYNTKKLTQSYRPGRTAADAEDFSLPSQHAAMAFVAATFLDRELGYKSPWISVAGYTAAGWVAYARVARNKHWVSDVLLGAAYGIIATNLSFWAYEGAMKLLTKKQISLSPFIGSNSAGVYLSYNF